MLDLQDRLDYPAAAQSQAANSAGLRALDYCFWDHRTPVSWKRCQKRGGRWRTSLLAHAKFCLGEKAEVTLITHMQHCGYAIRLFLEPGWSLHTLLCAHTSFGTSALPFIVCCCLMLCDFSRPQGWGENGKTRNATLLANCNAVQSKADSKFFHKPVQNWVLPLESGELRVPSLWPQDGIKRKRSWMVQAREGLPGALPATDEAACIRGNSLVLDVGIPWGATAAHNASAPSLI